VTAFTTLYTGAASAKRALTTTARFFPFPPFLFPPIILVFAMLSQLSSFIPDALKVQQAKAPPQPHPPSPDTDHTDTESVAPGLSSRGTDELGVRKKEKRSNEVRTLSFMPIRSSSYSK
jgi:hypothetical protein